MIKSNYGKTKIVVEFKAGTYDKEKLKEIQYLLFTDQLLVRVTVGINNHELLRKRNKYSTRILDLPENTNEVLLWRQVKRTGAKALHIFRNSNDNNNMKNVDRVGASKSIILGDMEIPTWLSS